MEDLLLSFFFFFSFLMVSTLYDQPVCLTGSSCMQKELLLCLNPHFGVFLSDLVLHLKPVLHD